MTCAVAEVLSPGANVMIGSGTRSVDDASAQEAATRAEVERLRASEIGTDAVNHGGTAGSRGNAGEP